MNRTKHRHAGAMDGPHDSPMQDNRRQAVHQILETNRREQLTEAAPACGCLLLAAKGQQVRAGQNGDQH